MALTKILFVSIFYLFFGCKDNSPEKCKNEKMFLENVATTKFGGHKKVIIEKKNIINKIEVLIKSNEPILDDNLVNNNLGYIAIYGFCKNQSYELFSLIFTRYFGKIVRTPDGKYYRNESLAEYIEKLAGLNYHN